MPLEVIRSVKCSPAVASATESARLRRVVSPPIFAALGEDGLEVALKEGAGVLEVLFGVSFGGGDTLKRFVENADDPLLFGKRHGIGAAVLF